MTMIAPTRTTTPMFGLELESATNLTAAQQQYRMLHDVCSLINSGDRHVLRSFSLTTAQYDLLMLLDMQQGRRMTDLSDDLLCDRSTITRVVDRLEQSGLIRRIADEEDRRVQRVVLTPAGAAIRGHARLVQGESLERRLSLLSEEEHEQLRLLLEKLRTGLQDRFC